MHGQENQLNKRVSKNPMIQQILLQSYAYIRKRSLSLGESTTERNLVNSAKISDTSKQII